MGLRFMGQALPPWLDWPCLNVGPGAVGEEWTWPFTCPWWTWEPPHCSPEPLVFWVFSLAVEANAFVPGRLAFPSLSGQAPRWKGLRDDRALDFGEARDRTLAGPVRGKVLAGTGPA